MVLFEIVGGAGFIGCGRNGDGGGFDPKEYVGVDGRGDDKRNIGVAVGFGFIVLCVERTSGHNFDVLGICGILVVAGMEEEGGAV